MSKQLSEDDEAIVAIQKQYTRFPGDTTDIDEGRALARAAEDGRDKYWFKWGQGMCPHNEPCEDNFVPRGGCERCWSELRQALKQQVGGRQVMTELKRLSEDDGAITKAVDIAWAKRNNDKQVEIPADVDIGRVVAHAAEVREGQRWIEWGEAPCVEHGHGRQIDSIPRKRCSECWWARKQQMEEASNDRTEEI